jgi:hypothetical protein
MCPRRIETIHTQASGGKDSGRVRSVYPTLPSRLTPEQFLCFDSECHGQLAEPFCRKRRLWAKSEQRVSAIQGLTYPDTLKKATL